MKWIGLLIGITGFLTGVIGITLFCRTKVEIRKLIKQLHYINEHETNKEITVGTPIKVLNELAVDINELIRNKKTSEQNYKRMDHELREAIANISHDLRTPLTSILGYVQLVEEKVFKSQQDEQHFLGAAVQNGEEDKTSEYLEVIRGRAEALNKLIQSFYELSKLSSHDYELGMEKVHIERITCELMAEFYQGFVDKNLNLEISIPDKLSPVRGDSGSVERVLMNLIQNTLRYAVKEVELEVKEEGNDIVLSLSNEAGNVKEEDLPYLYDRFFMTDRVRSGEGTGIGLAVVKKLMQLMSGEVSSRLENGRLYFILKWQKWDQSSNN